MLIKSLDLVLENCETITIDGKYIGEFLVDDIHTSICRSAINWIGEQTVTDTVVIEIHKDANMTYDCFGMHSKTNLFERLTHYDDITQIEFTLYDQYSDNDDVVDKKYHYLVSWDERYGQENNNQTSYLSKDGNLYIVISKEKKTINDYFDIEEIDDSECMDMYFDLFDVGNKYSDR